MGFHISPEANGMGEVFPHSLVFPYALFTLLDEWLYAVFFDLIFSVQTEFFSTSSSTGSPWVSQPAFLGT